MGREEMNYRTILHLCFCPKPSKCSGEASTNNPGEESCYDPTLQMTKPRLKRFNGLLRAIRLVRGRPRT